MQESVGNICVCLSAGFLLYNMETFNKLKQFDAYPKTLEDFRVKTWGGATGEKRYLLPEKKKEPVLAADANNKANSCFNS